MRQNSQEVGLEAAILERVRNSSLVECARADNVARLKPRTEAVDIHAAPSSYRGGGHACMGMVGERSLLRRSLTAKPGGAQGRANAGMSSVYGCANHPHRKPEGSWATSVVPG